MGFKRYNNDLITEDMKQLLRDTYTGPGKHVMQTMESKTILAAALGEILRKGNFWGDIASDIFQSFNFTPGQSIEYPLDPIAPGTEKDFVAMSVPKVGAIPNKNIEGDYLQMPTFLVGNGIEWSEKYARDARWDVVSRGMEILEAGFVKKFNDDAWHLILSAGLDRNIVIYNSDMPIGQFSKRLVSLMQTVMRRNGGGNSTSINRFKMTDLYVSPEAIQDIRNWGIDQIPDSVRAQYYTQKAGTISDIFGTDFHDLDELGEGQEYQLFYLNDLAGVLAPSTAELVVGLDLETVPAFKNPVVEGITIHPDIMVSRARKQGYWAEREYGLGITDNRPIILGSF